MLPLILTEKRKVLIIGAGRAAAIKLKSLSLAGYDVTVVSKKFSKELDKYSFKRVKGGFYNIKQNFLKKFDLIYIAIPIKKKKEQKFIKKVKKIGQKKLINVLARHELGNFIHPCTRKNSEFIVSVSTYGKEPKKACALSEKFVRERIERY